MYFIGRRRKKNLFHTLLTTHRLSNDVVSRSARDLREMTLHTPFFPDAHTRRSTCMRAGNCRRSLGHRRKRVLRVRIKPRIKV